MEHITYAVQVAGPGTTETLQGREYRVVPATLVKSKVLHNNLGRTFLPEDAFTAEWAQAANGAPVLIDHPKSRGAAVSARDPDVLNSMGVGFLFRTRAENAALKGDVFLDPSRAADVPDLAVILSKLDASEKVELSTGFGVSIDPTPGVINGAEYDMVIRPTGFDHLAVFAEQTGACSVKDGCGLAANHDGECEVENEEAPVEAPSWFTQQMDKLMALFKEQPTEPVANTGDHSEEGDMDRKQMIAQLVAAGRDEEALNKLSDCDLKALAGNREEPQGDGWEKATEWRRKYEALEAETQNARQSESKERADLMDDLLYNARNLPYTEQEIKAMDVVQMRKVHALAFPKRPDYSGRGGPQAAPARSFDFVRPILAGNAGESVLDRKEAH